MLTLDILSFVQLNLRYIIKGDILIYPGYIPEPGVKYRVFHYGLRFSVGDWSFNKADWRNTDMVNTCWAKFPDPPDPSSILSNASENDRQRDLLSFECGQALNKALLLHHERRNCRAPNAISSDLEENKGNDQHRHSSRKMFVPIDATNSSPSFHRSPPRIWRIGLWALSVLGLLAVISMVFSRHRQERLRFKSNRLGSQMPMEDLTKAITKAMTSISLTLNHTLTLEISLFILRIPSGRGTLGTFPPNLL